MSRHSNLDRQSFQDLLANAFAVEESHFDKQLLSALVESLRLIASRKLDLDGTMNLVADSARGVANAAGVAVGLLQGDQLIYRAGSGSAAADVESGWTASLPVSAETVAQQELIRVENADEDPRSQAEICRQLGAKSVLILPICKQQLLAGVIEVRFSEPHAFQEIEIQSYRLLAGFIEDALVQATPQNQDLPLPRAVPQRILPRTKIRFSYASIAAVVDALHQRCRAGLATFKEAPLFKRPAFLAALPGKMKQQVKKVTEHTRHAYASMPPAINALSQRCRAALATLRESSLFPRSASLAALLGTRVTQQMKKIAESMTLYKTRRSLAAAGIAVIVGLTCWMAIKHRVPAAPRAPSAALAVAVEKPAPLPQPKPPAGTITPKKVTSMPLVAPTAAPTSEQEAKIANTTHRRAGVSKDEVDYIRGDVTVRHFTYKLPNHRSAVRTNPVGHFGDDVTVRYFPPQQASQSASR